MKMTKVYDLPTRFFHWIFAGLFVSAFFIAKTFDDDSATYPIHMMLGLTMVLAVTFRILWGIFGSKHARFTSFALKPSELLTYLKSAIKEKTKLYSGHNPASSWLTIAMIFLTLGLGTTGILMVQKINKELFEEMHELFANAFIALVIAHIAGIILHTIKHKDMIGLSMIHGKKRLSDQSKEDSINSSSLVAFIFLTTIALFALNLGKNYDQSKKNLNLFGTHLQLGKIEKEKNIGSDND